MERHIMADISIPQDRDVACDLALKILKENSKLSREHGVTVPKMYLQELRKRARKTASVLKKVEALRRNADELAHGVDADIEAIEKALREIGQSVVHQVGVEAAKNWGFQFKSSHGQKPPKQ